MRFKYYVIGAGSIGTRHFNNLKELGQDVISLSWRGIDMDTLLHDLRAAQGQAGVVIATATKIRMPLIRDIADTGAALYIEKPVAYHPADVDAIFSLPLDIQMRSMAGFMMRYHPMVDYIRTAAPKHMFRAGLEIGHDVTQWRQNWTFADSYAADPDGGGVLLDLCHEIDLAHLFCGDLSLDTVRSTNHPDFPKVDIQSHLTLTSDRGVIANVSMDYLAPKLIRRGHLIGITAQLDYDLTQNTVCMTTATGVDRHEFAFERNEMFLGIMRDFIALSQGNSASNPIAPRLDLTKEVCHLISNAWASRTFSGQLRANLT